MSEREGILYVVATPIGNLEDISSRALRILGQADVVAAEDTRHTRRLLTHFGIQSNLISFHEHNEEARADDLAAEVLSGKCIALVTDAGTPAISDPGFRLVRAVRERGGRIEAVPGPSAPVAALSVSGLPTDRFVFHGFFPRKPGKAKEVLQQASQFPATHLFFEAPSRLTKTLGILREHLPECEACVARELTKTFEEVRTGTPADLCEHFGRKDVKGECVVLVHISLEAARQDAENSHAPEELRLAVHHAMEEEGLTRRDAVRAVAQRLGASKKDVYRAAVRDE
jgi:16S rRNA (cytidine1402-2'-O)-methyltransferase